MIRFISIELHNIYAWQHVTVPLSEQGLVIVDGLNMDADPQGRASNGSGKSSIFEALTCALYGSTTVEEDPKNLVNDSVGKGLEVILNLEVLDVPHQVIMRRKTAKSGPSITVLRDGVDITPKESYTKLRKRVPELIGMDISKAEFLSCVFYPQEFSSLLVFGKGKDRREFFSSVFGLEIYDVLYDVVLANIESRSSTISEIQNLESEITHLKSSEMYAVAQKGGPRDDLIEEMRERKTETSEQLEKVRRLRTRLVEYNRAVDHKATLQDRLEALGDEDVDVSELQEEVVDSRERHRVLDKQLRVYKEAKKSRTKLKEARQGLKALGFDPDQEPEELKVERGTLRDKIQKLHDEIEELSVIEGEARCPTCKHVLDKDKTERLLASYRADRKKHSTRRAELRKAISLCTERDQILLVKDELPDGFDPDDVIEEMEALRARVDEIENIIDRETSKTTLRKQIEAVAVPNKPKKTKDQINARIEKLQAAFDAVTEEIGAAREAQRRAKLFTTRLKELESKLGSLRKTARTLAILDELKILFNPNKGIKVKHLHAVLQAFEKELPQYTRRLFSEAFQFVVDDTKEDSIEIVAVHTKNDGKDSKRPLKVLSGGQRGRFAVAAQMALASIRSKAKSTNMLVLDEPGGGYLDGPGKESFVELLQEVRAQYESVFVITHDPQIREACQPDQVWTVKLQNDKSTLLIGN